MPRDSWVGVHECQQSVAGGLASFSHPSLPHLTLPCDVTQYSGTPIQRCPSRTTAPLKRLFFCALMLFTLLMTPEERRPL